MDLKALLAMVPEDKREDVKAFYQAEVDKAFEGGRSQTGVAGRKAEQRVRELEAEVERMTGELGTALTATDAKKLRDELAAAAKERDRLLPFRQEAEDRKLRELVLDAIKKHSGGGRLKDEALLDHVVRVSGAKLAVADKDGKREYALDEGGLKSWVDDPDNRKKRIEVPTGHPFAPPLAGRRAAGQVEETLARMPASARAEAEARLKSEGLM